mmetsp:Transcript_597/g.537  ORF Transcript_597/g.537 Transcript_597/m.537 type:complete len:124 (-) Transcript_597:180-551(-)
MDQLQLPHAKLLYFVAELYKSGDITDTEKTLLKEMIVGDDQKIFEFLEEYEDNGNETNFKQKVLGLVKPKDQDPMVVVVGNRKHDPPEQDDVSSPYGTQLLDKKRKQHHGKETHLDLANELQQ